MVCLITVSIRSANAEFCAVMRGIEQRSECKGLTMQSFLALPMQRVTRLPLLMDAVCHRIPEYHPDSPTACHTLSMLQKVRQLVLGNSNLMTVFFPFAVGEKMQ
jgi:hypothetical protein